MAYFEHFGTLDSGAFTTPDAVLDSIITNLGGNATIYYDPPGGSVPLTPLSVSWAPTGETGTWTLYDDLRNRGSYPRVGLDNTGAAAASLTFTNGSATVTGVNTTFLTDLKANYYIRTSASGTIYQISSITNDTSLTLTTTFGQTTYTGYATYCGPYSSGTDPFIQCLTMTTSLTGTHANPTSTTSITGTGTNFSSTLSPVGYYLHLFGGSNAMVCLNQISVVGGTTSLTLTGSTANSGGTTIPIQIGYPDASVVTQCGTALFTNGSTTVTGTSTQFLSELAPGSWIRTGSTGNWYQVASVASTTSLTLQAPFQESTTTSVGFSILRRNIILKCTSTIRDFYIKLTAPCDGRHVIYTTVLDNWNNSTHTATTWNRSTSKMRVLATGYSPTSSANTTFGGITTGQPVATMSVSVTAPNVGYILSLLPESIIFVTTGNTYQGKGSGLTDVFFAQNLIPYYTIANGFPSNDTYVLCHGGSTTRISRAFDQPTSTNNNPWPTQLTTGALETAGISTLTMPAANILLYKRADGTGGPWLPINSTNNTTTQSTHSYGLYPRHRPQGLDTYLNGYFPNNSVYYTVLDCAVLAGKTDSFVPTEPTIMRGEFRYFKVPCQEVPTPSRAQIKENGIYQNYYTFIPTPPEMPNSTVASLDYSVTSTTENFQNNRFHSSFDVWYIGASTNIVARQRILAIPQV